MNFRRILGILIVLLGAISIGVSYYIKEQVGEGETKIKSAQESVDKGNQLFSGSSNPIVKGFGQSMTGSAQKKINKGKEEVAQYTTFANQLQWAGIALIVLGAIVIVIPRRKRKR